MSPRNISGIVGVSHAELFVGLKKLVRPLPPQKRGRKSKTSARENKMYYRLSIAYSQEQQLRHDGLHLNNFSIKRRLTKA